jgi:hypothetical protein
MNKLIIRPHVFLFVGLRDRRLGILGYQKKIKIEISKNLKKKQTHGFVFSTSKSNMTTPNALNFHLQLR